jgi:putative ABC transport system permease protein
MTPPRQRTIDEERRRWTTTNPLWRKAPFVLLRFPALLAALAVGTLLLALAAAAYPLFISATTSELVDEQIAEPLVTRYGAGISYHSTNVPVTARAPGTGSERLYAEREALFIRRAAESPLLDPVISGVRGPIVSVAPAEDPGNSRPGSFFAGTDVLDHVDRVVGSDGSGAWVADAVAGPLHLEPGDPIVVESQDGKTVEITVDGIYRSLYLQPRSGYWLTWDREIYPLCRDCPPGPPFLLVDREQLLVMSRTLREPMATFGWIAPLKRSTGLTLDEAGDLSRLAETFEAEMSDPASRIGRVFDCCGVRYTTDYFTRGETRFLSRMPDIVSEAERRIAAVKAPGRLLEAAGIVVALIVIGMGGAFAFATRRTEANLLFARGMSPLGAWTKACLESIVPCLGGALIGLALAVGLVLGLGAEGSIASSAVVAAARAVAVGFIVSVLLVGVVSAIAFPRQLEHRAAHLGVLARVPWELVLLAFAVFCLRRLRAEEPLTTAAADTRDPSAFLVLFPISLVAGSALLGARALRWTARAWRSQAERLRPDAYLAVHRLAGRPGLATLLVSAGAICLGTFAYAQTVVRSLETTVEAKAGLFVGSDVQARVSRESPLPEDFPLPITRVTKVPGVGTLSPGGERFDLLAVDPETFASAAFWDDSLSDEPLAALTRALDDQGSGDVSILFVGSSAPDALDLEGRNVPVSVVGRARAFPGVIADHPLVVADADAIERAFADTMDPLLEPRASTQFWIKGDTAGVLRAIAGLEFAPELVLTAEDVADIPYIAAVVASFVALRILALVAAMLVVVVMLMYLQARQRGEAVSYALSLRMGMTEPSHRRALMLETGTMLGASFVFGVGLAVWAALLVVPLLDPLSSTPPRPLLVLPLLAGTVALLALAAVSWLGSRLAIRRARATHLGEVLRLAE